MKLSLSSAWNYVRQDHRLEPIYLYMVLLGSSVVYLAYLVGTPLS